MSVNYYKPCQALRKVHQHTQCAAFSCSKHSPTLGLLQPSPGEFCFSHSSKTTLPGEGLRERLARHPPGAEMRLALVGRCEGLGKAADLLEQLRSGLDQFVELRTYEIAWRSVRLG